MRAARCQNQKDITRLHFGECGEYYSPRGGGGYSWEFLVGVSRPVLQILTLFQTKNVIFHTRFQTWLLKSIPILRPGL